MEGIAKKIWILGIMTVGLAVLAPGCGSSGGSETSGSLSKAEFLKAGDKICQKRLEEKDAAVKAALEESGAAAGGQPSKQLQEEVGESILAVFRSVTHELDELSPPAKDAADLKRLTAKLEEGLNKGEADPMKMLRVDPFEDASEVARAFGFKACNF